MPPHLITAFEPPLVHTDPTRAARGSYTSEASAGAKPVSQTLDRDPRILLATTGKLPSTARLAMELQGAGATVSIIAPGNHPAMVLDILAHKLIYSAITPRRALETALRRLMPDAVIPCDERTVRDLHALCRSTRYPDVRVVIERSLGPPESYPAVTSRAELLALANRLGVRAPASMGVDDHADLDAWISQHPAPFVLKADGSWSGFGVRIISNTATAHQALSQMTRPSSAYLTFRETVLEGDRFVLRGWLRRERPVMSVQGYIDGWPANIGVACWKGEVLAATCAEAVTTLSATGPSTVARIIQNSEMVDTAKRIVRALGLSGLVGFDFMIEAASGAAYLIEMNPRNTPICAVRLGPGRDLPEAFVAQLAGRPVRERPAKTNCNVVAFFPDTLQQDPSSSFLQSGYHDVPWEQPALVRMLLKPELRERYWIMRKLSQARRKIRNSDERAN